jgi:hypothetical protein
MRSFIVVFGTSFAALISACGAPKIRDCDLQEPIADNGHDLSYSAVMPSNCPVPIGSIGEQKFIGANVVDGGAHDHGFVNITVRNSNGSEKGKDNAAFLLTASGAHRAQPRADYPAATGFSGSIVNGQALPASARDKGKFLAFLLSGSIGAAGELYVNYIGTTVQGSISGPDVPLSGSSGTWSGSASGGTGPYSYTWYRNGELVSTSSSYSSNVGSSEFGLRLQVTDQTASTRWTDFWVDVDGVRGSISGPTLVYYSEGDATWTLNPRGGYAPYSADWYFVDMENNQYSAGSGTSISGYPPHAGGWSILANVTDSHGTPTTVGGFYFTAIGDGNGGCTPVPPQITCDP